MLASEQFNPAWLAPRPGLAICMCVLEGSSPLRSHLFFSLTKFHRLWDSPKPSPPRIEFLHIVTLVQIISGHDSFIAVMDHAEGAASYCPDKLNSFISEGHR